MTVRPLGSVYFSYLISGNLPRPWAPAAVAASESTEIVRMQRHFGERVLNGILLGDAAARWRQNNTCAAPVGLATALLFDDLTVRRANEKNEKLRFYPPPD
jgi:hypothetical protein